MNDIHSYKEVSFNFYLTQTIEALYVIWCQNKASPDGSRNIYAKVNNINGRDTHETQGGRKTYKSNYSTNEHCPPEPVLHQY